MILVDCPHFTNPMHRCSICIDLETALDLLQKAGRFVSTRESYRFLEHCSKTYRVESEPLQSVTEPGPAQLQITEG